MGGYVNIDASIGRETKFIFDYQKNNGAGISVDVTSPSGKSYVNGMPEYVIDTSFQNIIVSIPGLNGSNNIYDVMNNDNDNDDDDDNGNDFDNDNDNENDNDNDNKRNNPLWNGLWQYKSFSAHLTLWRW